MSLTLEPFFRKMQLRQAQASYRDFLMYVTTWCSLGMYKTNWLISSIPKSDRVEVGNLSGWTEPRISRTYDHEMGFFENFTRLYTSSPRPNLKHFLENENSDYVELAYGVKNGYLSHVTWGDVENAMYSCFVFDNITNALDAAAVSQSCENIYSSCWVVKSREIFYSFDIEGSKDLWWCASMVVCNDCIFCDHLTNARYCISNKQLTKEEYFAERAKILAQRSQFAVWQASVPRIGRNVNCENVTGSSLKNCSDIQNWYLTIGITGGRNVICGGDTDLFKRAMNSFNFGGVSDIFGCCNAGLKSTHVYCSTDAGLGTTLIYCMQMESSSFCLGCIGLRNAEYCILNEQYTREEWYRIATQILTRMDQDGDLGAFLPASLNPHYFNDTPATIFGDFTRDEALAAGYLWRDHPISVAIPESAQKLSYADLWAYEKTDGTIDPAILTKVIIDAEGNPYTIVERELEFYQKFGLSLPREHWQTRRQKVFTITA